MIILKSHIHPDFDKAYLNNNELKLDAGTTFDHLKELARKFPQQWIGWTSIERPVSDWNDLLNKATVPYMVLSKGSAPGFLRDSIDYVDDTPFINFKEDQWYPTWMMSDNIGLIHSSVLQQEIEFKSTGNWIYDLNLFTRIYQSQGLFCYSQLSRERIQISSSEVFSFISQTKKKTWIFFLLLCQIYYEKKFPILAFAKALFKRQLNYTLRLEPIQYSVPESDMEKRYDVIIPTMGRASYLKDVLLDLDQQTIKPQQVIIIEQNGDHSSSSDLGFLNNENWSFKIIHKFIHQTGACNARNIAIAHTRSPWVLLFDDDNRFDKNLIERIFNSLSITKTAVLNMAYLQKGEIESQKTFKQWPFFGSGCSIVHRDVLEQCNFDMALEHGYGEDVDFGMQIRNAGYDVTYAPQIQILHLKAPIGGFRKSHVFPWDNEDVKPKPSPQIMYYRKKNYTHKQLSGYKMVQLFKTFGVFGTKLPWKHYKKYLQAWNQSEKWASRL
ncbi:glycosyltransferase family 2 protein [Nonlabens ulvanivorans]|uniref:GT2 family glycosyltransferase n=1 Tax=Nonlabens ulvanivorans TaxID=906888 RepID=A0A084JXR6_NONUL|nr:glycosyltransferase family A protein [Nonlabens ulvanivorans]KEZ93750.1 glycosyl transferase family 2 [Nonlabens ulvanivorans]PRX14345.1 GT2 family glycosyltransferase [Nonlabens ulvanivorans]